jgi:hypothetical protein
MAKNVHQQGVGTRTGIEFHPASPVNAREGTVAKSVNFFQTALQSRVREDSRVTCRHKVAVHCNPISRLETDYRSLAVAQTVGQIVVFSVAASTRCKFPAKSGSKVHKSPFACVGRTRLYAAIEFSLSLAVKPHTKNEGSMIAVDF